MPEFNTSYELILNLLDHTDLNEENPREFMEKNTQKHHIQEIVDGYQKIIRSNLPIEEHERWKKELSDIRNSPINMMWAFTPRLNKGYSVNIKNFLENCVDPLGFILVSGSIIQGLSIPTSFSGWIAFVSLLTSAVTKPVDFQECCILHKAWKLANFTHDFSEGDLIKEIEAIRDEYNIHSLDENSIRSSIEKLINLGAVSHSSQRGKYRLEEKIIMY